MVVGVEGQNHGLIEDHLGILNHGVVCRVLLEYHPPVKHMN